MNKVFEKLKAIDFRHILAVMVVAGIFGEQFLLAFKEIPAPNVALLTRGHDQILVLGFAAIIGYFFVATKKDNPTP